MSGRGAGAPRPDIAQAPPQPALSGQVSPRVMLEPGHSTGLPEADMTARDPKATSRRLDVFSYGLDLGRLPAELVWEDSVTGLRNVAIALVATLLSALPRTGSAADIAISLDDLPYAMPARVSLDDGRSIVSDINRVLKEHGIIAMGFAVGERITPETEPLIEAFVAAGHDIGNHSWSHPDFNKLTPDEFQAETIKTDKALSPWLVRQKFYRFPFLHQGETPEKLQTSIVILSKLGYRNVPVSIDNDDFQFNSDYTKALAEGDSDAAEMISEKYLEHMKERTSLLSEFGQEQVGEGHKTHCPSSYE